MKQMTIEHLSDKYKISNVMYEKTHLVNSLSGSFQDKKVLLWGYVFPYFDLFQNCDVFYAIPDGYEKSDEIIPLSNQIMRVDSIKRLPYEIDSFDIVLLLHIYDLFGNRYTDFITETARILKDQGKLINVNFVPAFPWFSFSWFKALFAPNVVDKIGEVISCNDSLDLEKFMLLRYYHNMLYTGVVELDYWRWSHREIMFKDDLLVVHASKSKYAKVENFVPVYGLANG